MESTDERPISAPSNGAGEEIQITWEMIEAGARVLYGYAETSDPVDAVREIYAAMEASRRGGPREGLSSLGGLLKSSCEGAQTEGNR